MTVDREKFEYRRGETERNIGETEKQRRTEGRQGHREERRRDRDTGRNGGENDTMKIGGESGRH